MVVGDGTMGRGIAQVAAQAGFKVVLKALNTKETLAALNSQLETCVGRVSCRGRAGGHSSFYYVDHDPGRGRRKLVIEAVQEDEDKQRISELDRVCRPDAVLASIHRGSVSLPWPWSPDRIR